MCQYLNWHIQTPSLLRSSTGQKLTEKLTHKKLELTEDLLIGLIDDQKTRRLVAVSESGMYNLVFTSRKAQAKVFKKWITSEVLPTNNLMTVNTP